MKAHIALIVLIACCLNVYAKNNASFGSENGRSIMRAANGELYAVTIKNGELIFLKKGEKQRSWNQTPITGYKGKKLGDVVDVAIDSSIVNGVYIAFTVKNGKHTLPYLAEILNKEKNEYTVYGPLTKKSVGDVFVAVSKGHRTGVAATWKTDRGDIYISTKSPGGKVKTQKIISDKNIVSGVAVSTSGKDTLINYVTSNSKYCPGKCPTGTAVYIETHDAGATWSKPEVLFSSFDVLPKISHYEKSGEKISGKKGRLTSFSADSTELVSLAWAANQGPRLAADGTELNDQIYFITNTVILDGSNDTSRGVGIVSFRGIYEKTWTHVIANDDVVSIDGQEFLGEGHQYSALPDTPVRGMMYTEYRGVNRAPEYVLALSTDTGKTFDHYVRLSTAELGLEPNQSYRISACLYKGPDGEVFQDIAVVSDGDVLHKQISTGIKVDRSDKPVIW